MQKVVSVFFIFLYCVSGKNAKAQTNLCFSTNTLSAITVGNSPQDVAHGDFNNDGNQDLVVANSGTNTISVLIGNGNGSFLNPVNYTVGSGPNAIGISDFNEDGIQDIVVANAYSNNISVLIGSSNGTFASQTNHPIGSIAYDIVCADFNGDNHTDIAVTNSASNNTSILLGTGAATFSTSVSLPGSDPRMLATSDFDNDGDKDLAIVNFGSNTLSVFLNTPTGFASAAQYGVSAQSMAIVTSDFNGDGVPDLGITNFSTDNKVSILLGYGNGAFASALTSDAGGNNAFSILAKDFNNDGKADLAIANSNELSMLYGTGTGAFQPPVNYSNEDGLALTCADFNNDGRPDLAVTKVAKGMITLNLGNNTGGFDMVHTFDKVRWVDDIIACDLNNDNETDFVISYNYEDSIGIIMSNAPANFHPFAKQLAVQGLETYQLSSADFNGDGIPDLAITGSSLAAGHNMSVKFGNGAGSLGTATSYTLTDPTSAITSADFNHDGFADIAVGYAGNGFSGKVNLYLNNGNGVYSISTYSLGLSVIYSMITTDLNNDGHIDICIASDLAFTTLTGNGTGSFTAFSYAIPIGAHGIVAADFNNDGRKDVAVGGSGAANNVYIYLATQTGFSSPVLYASGYPVESLAAADFNNDGKPDLIAGNGYSQMVSFFTGQGNGNFSQVVNYNIGGFAYKLIAEDFNDDGVTDVAVAGKTNFGFLFNKTASVKLLGAACIGNSILQATKGASSYNWSPGISTSDTTHISASGIYQVTINNSCGFSTSSINVNLNPVPVLTVTASQNTICAAGTNTLTATGAVNYLWSNNQQTQVTVVSPTVTTLYTVTGTDVNNCTGNYSITVTVNNSCADVWPGDANSDGIVDNTDVLELGLHYLQVGPSRTVTSNNWQAYSANNWAGTITGGQNLNHSDCNGDGIINNNDTLAIYANYGLTHISKQTLHSAVNPQLSIVADQTALVNGSRGTASVYLGDQVSPITAANGVAFTINIDNSLIEADSVYIEYQNSFLNSANDNLHFRKLNAVGGQLYTATTHTMSNNVSGYGKIAVLHYLVKSNLTGNPVANISISQAYQSSASGVIQPLTANTTSFVAIGTGTVGVKELVNHNLISIIPNPASSFITISSTADLKTIEVMNIAGQTVLSQKANSVTQQLNIEELANGIYMVKTTSVNGSTTVKRLVINK